MTTSVIRAAALLALSGFVLLAPSPAQGKDPTDAEKKQWTTAAELTRAMKEKLGDYAADVEHKRSYANPYEYEGKYTDEKWSGLAAAERELQPLRDALAAIEAKFGTDPDQLEVKVFNEYGNIIDPRQPGFSRRLSPDRSKWLDTETDWPFTFYKEAKALVNAPAQWRQLAEDFGIKHVRDAMTYHDKNYGDDKKVGPDRAPVTKLEALMPLLDKVLGYVPDDPELKQLKADLEAKIAEWREKVEELIDNTEWPPHGNMTSGDPNDLVDPLREHLATTEFGEPMAVRVWGDYEVYSHNLLGEPTCYLLWVEGVYPVKDDDDVAEVKMFKVYTPEGRGVNMGPPFKEVYHDSSHLIRPGNVSQQGGGGFFGTLIKLVLGFGCCFLFLGAVGGGGYFAYKQMNAQKADAVAGAPPAAPPGAPPAAPPAPPAG